VDGCLDTPIPHSDIVKLVSVCLNSNHFVFGNKTYYQKDGLPMGNRLSGVLAELFIQKVVDEITFSSLHRPPLFRYVDDLLIFGKDETDAKLTLDIFNSNGHGLKFTLELPVNGTLPYLDFRVGVSPNGEPNFNFYRKPMRKEISINAKSAFPKNSIENVIRSEIQRINNRCSDPHDAKVHKNLFLSTLIKNGHSPIAMKSLLRSPIKRRFNSEISSEKFFLSIPFINDKTDRLIRKSLAPLGVRILIAHKGKKLKNKLKDSNPELKCNMSNCKMKNHLCLRKGVVYHIQCQLCKANYIGSSWRHLHTRVKEHNTHKSSAVYTHNLSCNGTMCVSILANDNNIQRMRMKEAILIKQIKPSLNTKDDILGSHILFEC
jgi:predicted GIY-YIG superfamily endonuclease